MKSLAVAWFMVSMISFVHGINFKSCTRLAILGISQGMQSSQYETITGKASALFHANLVTISNSLAQILRVITTEFAHFLNLYKLTIDVSTGCNNECDTACCNCDITKQPPLCVLCCQEDP
ncbi:hypothetical protein V8G54_025913 [Vigna mungo]|uniref:Uncharacterized protein n=1 Tax=Vigna mungo TaxID=3915 RepID=A0AAQ3RLL7_VIGMU